MKTPVSKQEEGCGEWEDVVAPINEGYRTLYSKRLRVAGGWDWVEVSVSAVFIPDPDHKWSVMVGQSNSLLLSNGKQTIQPMAPGNIERENALPEKAANVLSEPELAAIREQLLGEYGKNETRDDS